MIELLKIKHILEAMEFIGSFGSSGPNWWKTTKTLEEILGESKTEVSIPVTKHYSRPMAKIPSSPLQSGQCLQAGAVTLELSPTV